MFDLLCVLIVVDFGVYDVRDVIVSVCGLDVVEKWYLCVVVDVCWLFVVDYFYD